MWVVCGEALSVETVAWVVSEGVVELFGELRVDGDAYVAGAVAAGGFGVGGYLGGEGAGLVSLFVRLVGWWYGCIPWDADRVGPS